MAEIIINQRQFELINKKIEEERKLSLANENWNKFSDSKKQSIIECLKMLHPKKGKLLKESSWYNTLGDIVGIFDPTGVVDLVNGISYITQGDNLFGFLSLISAVPYVGDIVAKPVMGALKIGAPSAKALNSILKTAKLGDTAKASADLAKLTATGGIVGKFVQGFGKVGSKLKGFIEKMPLGPFKGLKKTILQWIDLFEKGARTGKTVRYAGRTLAKRLPKLTKEEQIAKLTQLKNIAKDASFFKSYRTSVGPLSWKTIFGGMPQLVGRNKSVRALARQTKWWAGFLDWMNIGNFVGPDESLNQMGQEGLESKLSEYQKTPEAQQYFQDSFGTETAETSQTQTTNSSTTQSSGSGDKLGDFFKSLLGNQALKGALVAI